MKKILLLSELLLLAGCADTVMLGYPNIKYSPISEKQVTVFLGAPIPNTCNQIAMTILPLASKFQDSIDLARSEAAKVGGNYVDITSLSYKAGWATSAEKTLIGVIYRCSK